MDNHVIETPGHQLDLWDRKFALPNSLCLERDALMLYPETTFAIICFDIVSLRTINDGFSRRVGDMLLFAIRDWILSLNFGQLYRLESDEFGLLITSVEIDTALEKAQYIFNRFNEAWDIRKNGGSLHVFCSVSMGVVSSKDFHSPGDILNIIERVLKTASEQENIVVFDEEANKLLKRRLEIEMSLKACVKNNMQGFSVYYQPIVSSLTGLWCGLEALCRWTSPELGEVPPVEFIPITEQQGLVGFVGEWVLEESVKQCKLWMLDELDEFFLDVNLSPVQLQDERLDIKVLEILERYDYPTSKLSLEITESTQLNFNNHTLDAISRLTQKNIPVALDDFGTGYSSFHSLVNLPVSVLKTEKVFLDNIENDEYLQRLLETMVSLAHTSGMKMTVEGVESSGQMKILMDNRVDYVQGYLFSKPLPSDELEQKLANFYHKEANSAAGEYSRIDINLLLNSENAYSLPPSLYRTLIRCMQILFNASDINEGIGAVLELIGDRLGVNRHVLFLRDKETNTFTNTHEWCDDAEHSMLGSYVDIDINEATPSFIPLFEKEGMIVSPDISVLPDDIYKMFCEIGVRSNIAIPLWRGRELLGYVGLDVFKERRNWLPEEVFLVHSVCGILANVLDRIYMQREITHGADTLKTILDSMNVAVYVTDPDTDEILYVNKVLQDSLGGETSPVGKICWQTLYGSGDKRCAFCNITQLRNSPENSPVIWECADKELGRSFITHNLLIKWENGKDVHLAYSYIL